MHCDKQAPKSRQVSTQLKLKNTLGKIFWEKRWKLFWKFLRKYSENAFANVLSNTLDNVLWNTLENTFANWEQAGELRDSCWPSVHSAKMGESSRSTFIRWTCPIFRRQIWIVGDLRLLIFRSARSGFIWQPSCQYKYTDTQVKCGQKYLTFDFLVKYLLCLNKGSECLRLKRYWRKKSFEPNWSHPTPISYSNHLSEGSTLTSVHINNGSFHSWLKSDGKWLGKLIFESTRLLSIQENCLFCLFLND